MGVLIEICQIWVLTEVYLHFENKVGALLFGLEVKYPEELAFPGKLVQSEEILFDVTNSLEEESDDVGLIIDDYNFEGSYFIPAVDEFDDFVWFGVDGDKKFLIFWYCWLHCNYKLK